MIPLNHQRPLKYPGLDAKRQPTLQEMALALFAQSGSKGPYQVPVRVASVDEVPQISYAPGLLADIVGKGAGVTFHAVTKSSEVKRLRCRSHANKVP